MVQGFFFLLACQFAGEAFVFFLDVPIPGSVVGMVVLFVTLVLIGRVPQGLRDVSDGLLKCLPLLLVPAGVGLMNHFGVLSQYWAGLLISLFVSTLVTMLVVSLLLKSLSPADKSDQR